MSGLYVWLNKHRRAIERLWGPLSTIMANIVIILTLILALASYYQSQKLSQVGASLSYVDRFNEGEILASRNLIYRRWLPYDFSQSEAARSNEVINELLVRMIPANATEENVEHRLAVAVIVAYFDSAQACISQGTCGGGIIEAQIGVYARDFYCLYRPIIERDQARANMPAFGSGLRALALRLGGC